MALYETNYAVANAKDLKKMAMKSILINSYLSTDDDPVLRGRIESAYKELIGVELAPKGFDVDEMIPMFLHGSPGHGKTSLVKDAAKSVAEALSMNFVSEPDEYPGTNDFVFILYETSGVLSTTELGGIPALETITMPKEWKDKKLVDADAKEEYEVLSKKALKQFVALDRSRLGVIIFDDASNANKNVQNALLSLCEEKKFQSSSIGKHTTGFLTGNIGSDGTYVIDPSSALLNRTANYYVEDTVKDWLERESSGNGDAIGIAGLNAFFKNAPETFSERANAKKGSPTPFASPRSWTKFLKTLRRWMVDHNSNPKSARLSSLSLDSEAILGRAVSEKLSSFYHAYTLGASEVANDFIANGKISPSSKDKVNSNYGGKGKAGFGAAAQDFGYAFASSLSESGAYELVNAYKDSGEKGFSQVLSNFTEGLKIISADAPMAGFAINRLHERMVTLIEGNSDYDISLSSRLTGKVIPMNMRIEMHTMFSDAGVDSTAVSDMLTCSNKIISPK